jgi:hypothetical protein
MAPSGDAFAFFGDAMNRVLMRYIGAYDSEYINCPMSGNHYQTGKGQTFQVNAGDVDDLIQQGVAELVKSEQLVTPKAKAKSE